jgi:hypothetical protein
MRGLWNLPDLWTRKRTRAHEVLGRRRTDASAHSSHRPHLQEVYSDEELALIRPTA